MTTTALYTLGPIPAHSLHFVFRLEGEVDETNLPQVESALHAFVHEKKEGALVLDFEKLQFINSKVVGYLAALYSSLKKQNRPLLIARMNENINDILTLVGLTTLIPVFTNLEDAYKTL